MFETKNNPWKILYEFSNRTSVHRRNMFEKRRGENEDICLKNGGVKMKGYS